MEDAGSGSGSDGLAGSGRGRDPGWPASVAAAVAWRSVLHPRRLAGAAALPVQAVGWRGWRCSRPLRRLRVRRRSRAPRPAISTCWQSRRGGVQSQLHLLLLPLQGGTVSGERLSHGGRSAGDLHSPAGRVAAAVGDDCVAGRRTHAHGPGFFRRSVALVEKYRKPGQRVNTPSRPTGRGWTTPGASSSSSTDSWWPERGWAARAARPLPGGQGRQGNLRPGDAGWELLKQHAVECNILCTVHAGNAGHALTVYRFFRDTLGPDSCSSSRLWSEWTRTWFRWRTWVGGAGRRRAAALSPGRQPGDGTVGEAGATGAIPG